MALNFTELRALFVEKLLNSTKVPAAELNNLVDQLITTCEFEVDNFNESFKGTATTSTNPGTPTAKCWYLASGPGTYTNFGGTVVTEEFAILAWNGAAWTLSEQNIAVVMTDYYTKIESNNEYLEIGKNLFNKDTINAGKYVETNGTLTTNAGYNASDYIAVTAGESYYINTATGARRAYYNASKVFVAGSYLNNTTQLWVAPAGAYFVRFSVATSVNINTLQLEHGTAATTYEAWALKFKTSKTNYKLPNDLDANNNKVINLADGVNPGDAMPFGQYNDLTIEVGKNKFNKATINANYYVDHSTGNLVGHPSYTATDYIAVLPETSYYINQVVALKYAWYNSAKVFISGSNVASHVIASPVGAAYLRYSSDETTFLIDTHQCEIGTSETNYNSYIERLRKEKLEVYPTNFPDGFPYADYIIRDDIKHSVIIDKNGNGDYTTITDAYAAITDCSFENQYEFILFPGVYSEDFLTPPNFSHTYALFPNSVIVSDDGTSSAVFELRGSCKLSNFTIKKSIAGSYCIHYDTDGDYNIRVMKNLVLIQLLASSIIGGGSWKDYEPIYINCKYVALGADASMHTNNMSLSNQRTVVRHINDVIGDRSFALNSVGGNGYYEAEFINCKGTKGIASVKTSITVNPPRIVANWWEYPANSWEWVITGGGNKDFCIKPTTGRGQALLFSALNYVDQFTISGTAVECLFGNYKYTKGGARIYAKLKGFWDVRDVQNGGTTDVIQMWKRLGDCSSVNKTLTITIGATVQTYTFTLNYLTTKTAEATIIAAINGAITQVALSKIDGSDNFDCIQTTEKAIVVCQVANSILKHEFLMISGTDYVLATTNIEKYRIIGIAVNEAVTGELLEVWSGPIYISGLANGEYGIGAAGTLDITQSNKVGFVYNAIFYPYY